VPLPRFLSFAGALILAALPAAAADVVFKISDAAGRPVADAVVSLIPLDSVPPPLTPTAGAEITQQKQQFIPLVTVVTAGSSVTFSNRESGRTEHQIYSVSEPNKFEVGLHKPGNTAAVKLAHPGVVAIGCNIHGGMNAYVVVAPTPWFAKSAADGAARVVSPPAGRYRAEVWHPHLDNPKDKPDQVESRIITLPAAPTDLAFVLKLTKPATPGLRMLNGGAGGYK
jgi:plastocyanin